MVIVMQFPSYSHVDTKLEDFGFPANRRAKIMGKLKDFSQPNEEKTTADIENYLQGKNSITKSHIRFIYERILTPKKPELSANIPLPEPKPSPENPIKPVAIPSGNNADSLETFFSEYSKALIAIKYAPIHNINYAKAFIKNMNKSPENLTEEDIEIYLSSKVYAQHDRNIRVRSLKTLLCFIKTGKVYKEPRKVVVIPSENQADKLGTFLSEYSKALIAGGFKIDKRIKHAKKFISYMNKPPEQITKEDMEEYMTTKSFTELGKKRIGDSLRKLLNFIKTGEVQKNTHTNRERYGEIANASEVLERLSASESRFESVKSGKFYCKKFNGYTPLCQVKACNCINRVRSHLNVNSEPQKILMLTH